MDAIKSIVIVVGMLAAGCSGQTENDRREKSPHFKNGIFHNSKESKKHSFGDVLQLLKMKLTSKWAKWPKWIDIGEGKKPIPRLEESGIRLTFINHATFLIQAGGHNILTDPIYSHRCSPVSFAGPVRVHKPAIPFDDLPKIDVILISHDHYDHLDMPTLSRLVQRDRPRIYVGLGVADRFDSKEHIIELDWWESTSVEKNFKLTFTEVQHFSGRTLTDRNSTLWGGFVLEIENKKIYFGGDSGYADHYKKTFEKFGPMDLALLPIGAYAPRFFMKNAHVDPLQAVQAHLDLRSQQSIGMHYGTFQLTAEPRDEPPRLLEKVKQRRAIPPEKFITLKPGVPFFLP